MAPFCPAVSHPSHRTQPGLVLSLGQGDVGQLGLGEGVMERKKPALVQLPELIVQAEAGGMHTVCLSETGKVRAAFGLVGKGQRGDAGGRLSCAPPAARGCPLVLERGQDQILLCPRDAAGWQLAGLPCCSSWMVSVPPTSKILGCRGTSRPGGAASPGFMHVLLNSASLPDRLTLQIYTFGCNDEGALGRDTSAEGSETTPGLVELQEKVVQVSAGDSHTAALTDDGRVFVWGSFRVRRFLRKALEALRGVAGLLQ